MSNRTRLQANNTNLQSLIEKANALPDAGENIKTCTITIADITEVFNTNFQIYYIDSNGNHAHTYTSKDATTILATCGLITIYDMVGNAIDCNCSGEATLAFLGYDTCAYYVSGDCQINVTGVRG